MLSALRGGLGFLTRIPVGQDAESWEAFTDAPVVFVLVGYVIGCLGALVLLAPLPAPTVAFGFLVVTYALTGINHLDGVADLGDAVVVHGGQARRRSVLKDTTVGVGGIFAILAVLVGLVSAVDVLARAPARAALIAVGAEVGAKLAVAVLACLGSATHEGLGAEVSDGLDARSALLPIAVALPVAGLTWPHPGAGGALLGAIAVVAPMAWWSRSYLGGLNGDVLGATAEIARVIGLHAGVIVWTLF